LEFRYFIVPFILFTITVFRNVEVMTIGMGFQLFLNITINLITIYIFLFKTFTWDTGTKNESIARFMW
jgi:hypothetical protein